MATDPRVQEFLNSPAYRDFRQSQLGMGHTMDMYDSPYFGSIGSGSMGRAQDAAYEQFLRDNPTVRGGSNFGENRPQHPEFIEYNQRYNEEIGKLPAATAYDDAHAQLRAFTVANPWQTYRGYGADPTLKAQYDALYKAMQDSRKALLDETRSWAQENPYTGPEPLTYTMGTNDNTTMPLPEYGTLDPVTGIPTEYDTTELDRSQSTLSPNFATYVYNMLAKGEQAANLPFQAYTGERFAGPSNLQQQAFARYAGMAEPSQFGEATGIARLASQLAQGIGASYSPTQFTADRITPQSLQNFQMGQPRDVYAERAQAAQLGAAPQMQGVTAQAARLGAAPQATAAQMQGPGAVGFERVGAERVSAPSLRDLSMQAAAPVSAERVGTQGITAAQTGYAPNLRTFQMSPAERISGLPTATARDIRAAQTGYSPDLQAFQMQAPTERVTSESFAQPGTAEALMSPYIQGVIDKQTREAIRQADIARGGRGARYAQAGAFGGSRQAIEEAEAERNLQQQLGDITATGLQSAYQQAQQQFNQEQQARQAAQQANIGTGLTVEQQNLASRLGVQQLGTQTGLQTALANLTNQQQAAVQSEANRLQAQGMNQQQALQTALANQQAGMRVGEQNLAAQLGVQQLGTQTGLQTALANLSNQQQAAVQNEANRLQAQGMNQQQALQAALANQGVQQQAGIQNLSAALQTQGLGAQTGLQAQQLNQATGLQALLANQQAGMQTGQFNAQQAYNTALQNAQMEQQTRQANTQLLAQYGLQGAQLEQAANMLTAQQMQQANQANQQMLGQYGLQQGQFQQAANMQNPQQALQAALANQQTGLATGQQNLAANLGVQQLGAQQNLAAQQANQQYGLEAQKLSDAARQFGATLNYKGLESLLSSGQLMSGIGAQAGNYGLQGLQGLLNAGATQQQLAQQPYDFGYQQWQQSQQYPFQQATYMQSLLGGLPLQAAKYDSGTSGIAGAAQGALTGLGIYNMMNQPTTGTTGGK
jgi:hypothetical protein